jgi:ATP-dependent DNA ligase
MFELYSYALQVELAEMASEGVYLFDILDAIQDGTIPGEFRDNIFYFPTIVANSNTGKSLLWTITVALEHSGKLVKILDKYLKQPVPQLGQGYVGIISVKSGQQGRPARKAAETRITEGKNTTKKNATNVITQAFRDAFGKYRHKLKVASANTVKKSNMYPPILIKKNGETKASTLTEDDIAVGVIVQPKLDGVRVVSYRQDDEIIMYSRKLGIYPGKEHIRTDLKQLFKIADRKCMQKSGNIYFDGEIYKHGMSLQDISGQSRRNEHELDDLLEYHIFDCFFPEHLEIQSAERQAVLDAIFEEFDGEHVKRVENYVPQSLDEVYLLKDQYIKDGYEGIVVRRNTGIYKYSYNNSRTNDIIKLKQRYSDEFECIGYKDGKGKNKGVLTWICQTKNGEQFAADPKDMSLDDRKHLFSILSQPSREDPSVTNFVKYLKGKLLTIEYEDISNKGVPLRLKALAFRTYEETPGEDIVAAIMRL